MQSLHGVGWWEDYGWWTVKKTSEKDSGLHLSYHPSIDLD
jgi:hypothetical protein